jgi:hypothetical protein
MTMIYTGLELVKMSELNLQDALERYHPGMIGRSLAILTVATTRSMMDLQGVTGHIADLDGNHHQDGATPRR